MSDATQLALVELVNTIGLGDALEVLEFALPHIAKRRKDIQRYLAAADWEGAARVAHKTLSSVRAYSFGPLEQHLQQIYQKDIAVISTAGFQQALLEEFIQVEQAISAWLVQHHVSPPKRERTYSGAPSGE